MGSRSLIAFQRDNGNFNVHYSHWGGYKLVLESKISKNEPLGGDNPAPDFVTNMVNRFADQDMDVRGKLTEAQSPTAVQAEPDIVNVEKDDLGTVVDDHPDAIEALYVVTREFDVTGFIVINVRFGRSSFGNLLVRPPWRDDADEPKYTATKSRLYGRKTMLDRIVDDDVMSAHDAYTTFLDDVLQTFHQRPGRRVLPQSTAIPQSLYADYIGAFFEFASYSNIPPESTLRSGHRLNTAVPSGFHDYQPWEIPSDFPNPEEYDGNAEKLNPEQYDANGNFIPDASDNPDSDTVHEQSSLTNTEFNTSA